MKSQRYAEALTEIQAVFKDEGSSRIDDIAMMATINAVLVGKFPSFFWTGFYRVCGNALIVGPYIGTVGCLEVAFGKGVCGTSAAERRTVIVPEVEKFPGHIACDPRTRSEIVVPVFGPAGELIAVLDVDSTEPAAFDEEDAKGLEAICGLFR